jgi:hypothetical protein
MFGDHFSSFPASSSATASATLFVSNDLDQVDFHLIEHAVANDSHLHYDPFTI